MGFFQAKGAMHFDLVRFKEAKERDLVLHWPWVVMGQAMVVEPWWLGFFLAKGAMHFDLVWIHFSWLLMEF